ncbi:hypothetical protein L198_01550 [Cryptococcus wingfieldii CBS 7118]|uniref:Uncharacterized protein n=1 Tax=Cryptococcus wingfieldii CBS 7118 TaxID=1295528 RepID=A0A1E3JZJ7_9TREE|nr:hypothetical protein L198_01550 [Cryptococcus wingfieldii CBS 7118]ODO06318.1 hypothetical protein L198_01550 [Cryptococcus wingfieldii CBS 7118]
MTLKRRCFRRRSAGDVEVAAEESRRSSIHQTPQTGKRAEKRRSDASRSLVTVVGHYYESNDFIHCGEAFAEFFLVLKHVVFAHSLDVGGNALFQTFLMVVV